MNTVFVFRLKGEVTKYLPTVAGQRKAKTKFLRVVAGQKKSGDERSEKADGVAVAQQ
ncbi:hypothetical protein JI666_01075 [Bacillus sp. NTK071]|uniref:hypothetical protein n=1 Tax=Bacillus sp. NTK071 TaxID=2802175 RepID=UPI001A8E7A76|nr:hypothetical protein [Bacillus sp. NTK071]MBN8207333.1 hypothetical protein [Bacillus sp. NTK071]